MRHCDGLYYRSSPVSAATLRVPVIFSLAFALCLAARPSAAGTVVVPPVTISQLYHYTSSTYIDDGILMPGPGYSSSGWFLANVSPGDVVRIRIQAPAGKKFVVHVPAGFGKETFSFSLYWFTESGVNGDVDPHTVTFEGFHGTMPTETYSYVAIGDQAKAIWANKVYTVTGGFEFTAIQIELTASQLLIPWSRIFNEVQSSTAPAWSVSARTSGLDATLMEIVDANPVPTRATSWGKLKSLYR